LSLTLKLVSIIARGVDNIPTSFGVSRTFPSRLIGQHLSDASRHLATLTFDLLPYVRGRGIKIQSGIMAKEAGLLHPHL